MPEAPVFTATALITLALGLVVSTSIAPVLKAYLIRMMPYPESDRLYHFMYLQPGQPEPRGMVLLDWRSLEDVVDIADITSEARFYLNCALRALSEVVAPCGAFGSPDALRASAAPRCTATLRF